MDLHFAKKIVIGVFGITLLIIGFALLVLPGPGLLLIFFALALLAGEFLWARRFLRKFKEEVKIVRKKVDNEIKIVKKNLVRSS